MTRSPRAVSLLLVSLLLVSLLLAAACQADPTGTATEIAKPDTTAPTVTTTVPPPELPAQRPTSEAQWRTYNDIEAAWAAKRIADAGWGVDSGGVLRGPDGWSVRWGACGEDAPDAGLDAETIRIAHLGPGPPIPAGSSSPFDVIGAAIADAVARAGPITDSRGRTRTVELVERYANDGFFAHQALRELNERQPVFAVTHFGLSSALEVIDEADRQCLPQLVLSGHPGFGDPENHPWTMGLGLAATTEAELWGRHIEATTPPGAKVAALVMNNDLGRAYLDGFERFVARSDHGIVFDYVTTEPAGGINLADDLDPVAAMDADVLIAMTAGMGCRTVVEDAERLGLNRTIAQRWLPSGCASGSLPDGGNGWLAFRAPLAHTTDTGPAPTNLLDPADPTAGAALDRLRAAGPESLLPGSDLALQGLLAGHVLIESLRVAAALPGGLSRPNLLLAMRTMQLSSPFLQPGVALATAGGEDAFALEHAELVRYAGGARGAFTFVSGPHGTAETTAPCRWDRQALRCH